LITNLAAHYVIFLDNLLLRIAYAKMCSFHTSDLLVLDIITPLYKLLISLLYCIRLLFVTSGRDDKKRNSCLKSNPSRRDCSLLL